MKKKRPTKDYVPREIINDQLLGALNDKAKVAVVYEEKDLVLLINLCYYYVGDTNYDDSDIPTVKQLLDDLRALKDAAFGS